MHGRFLGPVLGSIAVAAVVAASFSGTGRWSSHNSAGTPTTSSLGAASGEEQFCPSAAEVQEHWDTYGEELKPDPDCPDLEPTADEQAAQRTMADQATRRQGASHPHQHGQERAEPTLITTMRQAQDVLDPEDDPLVLVDRDAKGRYLAIHITLAPGQSSPPAWVRTGDQFAAWLENLSAGESEGSRQ